MKDFLFSKDNRIKILFMLGALLGAVSFIGVYGTRVLEFSNNGWLFYGDNDLRQHYIAWCNYRKDPWHFPIGLIDSLSYPYSMSVIYTDSIPLFAVVFKLFNGALPQTFQYFGLFGILSFMLMGGLSAILLNRFTDNLPACVIGSEFYILSFTVIQRMYYHTALSAQWIIILALIIWVYDNPNVSCAKKCATWAGMGFLCVAIHSYFLPMAGMILAALMVQQFYFKWAECKDVIKSLTVPVLEMLFFCVAGLINLWILGGFYGESSGYAGGLGSFNANLNMFINPQNHGRILKRLPLYYDFQHEGFAYLGCGIIFLFIIVAVGMIFRIIRRVPEATFHSSKVYGRIVCTVFVVSVLSSVLPLISINDKKIIWIPYPQIVERVLGIFRSNGRFIWVAMYILITAAISFTVYTFRQDKILLIVLLLMAVVIQVYDGSNMYKTRRDYYSGDYPVFTIWDDSEFSELVKDKKEFIFLYNENDITMLTAYYGYLHGMRQNNYYFARDIDKSINSNIDIVLDELSNNLVRDDVVYVVKSEQYEENKDFYDNLPVRSVNKYDYYAFTR